MADDRGRRPVNLLFSSIGRRGYIAEWFREHLEEDDRIIGTSNTRWTPGFAACDRAVLMPDIDDPAYVDELLRVCEDEGVDVLLSFFDDDVDRLAPVRDRFVAAGVTPFVPDARVSRIASDKVEASAFLHEQAIGTPRTYADVDSARVALAAGEIAYPVHVKPRRGHASVGQHVVRDDDELRFVVGRSEDVIVQEHVDGSEHSLDVLNDLDERVVSVIVKRKVSMRAGETDQAVTVRHPEALDVGSRLGASLGHVGPLDVDLIVDGDRLAVLDLNVRFGGAYPAAHLAGADFPRKIVAMARGERVAPDVGDYELGVGMMKDYRILGAYPGPIEDRRRAPR